MMVRTRGTISAADGSKAARGSVAEAGVNTAAGEKGLN